MPDCSKCPIKAECVTINADIKRENVIPSTATLCTLKVITEWAGGIFKDMALCPVKLVQNSMLDGQVGKFCLK